MFGFKIISRDEYEYLKMCEERVTVLLRERFEKAENKFKKGIEPKVVNNCGYKSCQFQTTDMRGLKIHRSRIHKNK